MERADHCAGGGVRQTRDPLLARGRDEGVQTCKSPTPPALDQMKGAMVS